MPDGTAGSHPQDDNVKTRYEIVKEKFARLDEIDKEKKELDDEAEEIRQSLEADSGFARGAVAAVRKVKKLGSAASIQKHIDNRNELEALFIKPILDEAAAGQDDE